jgi:cysteine synthase A
MMMRMSLYLLQEGIFTGTSGGGILAAALSFAKTAEEGSSIVAMLPDTGERYLSTPLFDGIGADMTEAEKEIASSTPSSPPPAVPLPPATDESAAFVKDNIAKNKIVIWSLQYCEFCWTLTSFFDKIGVPYIEISIDSFEYASDNMGNKYRSALTELTECNTFPQCFINGHFTGGAVDALMKWKKGELQPVLKEAGIDVDNSYEGDPFEFLPKWVSCCFCQVHSFCSYGAKSLSFINLIADDPESTSFKVNFGYQLWLKIRVHFQLKLLFVCKSLLVHERNL